MAIRNDEGIQGNIENWNFEISSSVQLSDDKMLDRLECEREWGHKDEVNKK